MSVRSLFWSFLAGVTVTLATLVWLGPNALVQAGLKLEAMQTTYAYDARPMLTIDESQILAELSKPPVPKNKRR